EGKPCLSCGMPPCRHRVTHEPNGNPCVICRLPDACHVRVNNNRNTDRSNIRANSHEREREIDWGTLDPIYLCIDGEGQGKRNHKYIFLACADSENKFQRSVENNNGLTSEECLDFILDLPKKQ